MVSESVAELLQYVFAIFGILLNISISKLTGGGNAGHDPYRGFVSNPAQLPGCGPLPEGEWGQCQILRLVSLLCDCTDTVARTNQCMCASLRLVVLQHSLNSVTLLFHPNSFSLKTVRWLASVKRYL